MEFVFIITLFEVYNCPVTKGVRYTFVSFGSRLIAVLALV